MTNGMKITFVAILVAAIALAGVLIFTSTNNDYPINIESREMNTFGSYNEIVEYVKNNQGGNYYSGDLVATGSVSMESAKAADSGGSADSYSTTNIQVEGVDEPDFVKNDGKYIYTLSGKTLS